MAVKIALVGEAYGEEEERLGFPFVGSAGRELLALLVEAGIVEQPTGRIFDPKVMRDFWLTQDILLTNVFNLRPGPRNDIETLCCSKAEDRSGFPPLRAGKYIRHEYLPQLHRLAEELRAAKPNVTVALGNTAAWALLGNAGISKIRGSVAAARLIPDLKVVPTYHPAAILRQWDLRHVTVFDLMKAKRESAYADIRLPKRTVYIEPNLQDLEWFYVNHVMAAKFLSVDIETRGDQITCIGFAPRVDLALVVPFVDLRRGGNYWPTAQEELRAWSFVRRCLESPSQKLFQNGLYDMHFLWRRYGLITRHAEHDTMLLHHALHPESEKGLGFLGSVYTNEASWKLMRTATIKRDQ